MYMNQCNVYMKKMSFLDENEMKASVSTLNVENISEKNVQSKISPSDLNDVNL